MFSGVYGCPYKIKKHVSWEYFKNLTKNVEIPWLIAGDLNFHPFEF